jgi:uncharacterized membrane protein
LPVALLLLLFAAYFAVLGYSAAILPPRVASHFDVHGRPDGWMSKEGYLRFMAVLGIVLPLLVWSTALLTRVLPPTMVNLPHREYWLSPERREATCAYLAGKMAWLACSFVLFLTGLHWLVVKANRQQPVVLTNGIWVLTAAFLIAIGAWLAGLVWRFSRPPAGERL